MISTQAVPINSLKAAVYNPRRMTAHEFQGLKNSILQFGLVDPIIVNKDYTIIGGHMRVQAASELNMTEVPCVVLDLSKTQEKKLNVLLNSQKINGAYDDEKLSEILEELKVESPDDYNDLRLDELEPLDMSGEQPEDTKSSSNKQSSPSLVITFDDTGYREDALAELVEGDFAGRFNCQIKEKGEG